MKKICFITGSRAEYGLLKPLMALFKEDKDVEFQLIVTGMHLSLEFGSTYLEIENDGFNIDDKLEILLSSDTKYGIAKSTGLGLIAFADSFRRLVPDMIIVLGDRFEILSAVTAAFMLRIPVVHFDGGETTEGAFDEGIRHAITKMSYLHFTSADQYRNRVIQLGECPDRVFNVGAIGIDSIKNMLLLSKDELQQRIGFNFGLKNILVTFHPTTLENDTYEEQFSHLLNVIEKYPDIRVIFTKSNADNGGRKINLMIDEYVAKKNGLAKAFFSMGTTLYLSTLQYVDGVVGNSSSGIFEVPSFAIGTINIGDRQKGRIKPSSVIDCEADFTSINNAFNKLFSSEFKNSLKNIDNPYGNGTAAIQAYNIIKRHEFGVNCLKKKFYDI